MKETMHRKLVELDADIQGGARLCGSSLPSHTKTDQRQPLATFLEELAGRTEDGHTHSSVAGRARALHAESQQRFKPWPSPHQCP